MDRSDALAHVRLFSSVLAEGERQALVATSERVHLPPGHVLMTEGDFGTSMFVIEEGAVSVTASDVRGISRPVAKLGKGDIVGEMSLMTGARRNATVVALTGIDALEVPKPALEGVLARRPELVERFKPELARRQTELDRILAEAKARWHVFGLSGDELVAEMRRFFAGVA